MISYDLIKLGKDYQVLYDELERLGAERVLLSQWAVNRTKTSCGGLRDYLRKFIDSNDRLLVTELGEWAACNALTDLNAL